jgi:hypothetical protein
VADPSGVLGVKVSIRNSPGNHWNGTAFGTATETYLTAGLAVAGATNTTWSYPLARPTDGTYAIHLKTTDLLGNTQAAASYAATSNFTIDTVAPTITFSGNKGAYGLLDTVAITCVAADPAPGSGVNTNPCTGFSIAGPGWSFKPGTNTLPSPGLVATDSAGNSSAPATTSFTVTVTGSTLGQLGLQFVQGSAKYAALTPWQKQIVTAIVKGAGQVLAGDRPQALPRRQGSARERLRGSGEVTR